MADNKIQAVHEVVLDIMSVLSDVRLAAERYQESGEAKKDACSRQFVAAAYAMEDAREVFSNLGPRNTIMLPFACHAPGVAKCGQMVESSFHQLADSISMDVICEAVDAILTHLFSDWPPTGEYMMSSGFPREADCLTAVIPATKAVLDACPSFDELNNLSASLEQEYARTLRGEGQDGNSHATNDPGSWSFPAIIKTWEKRFGVCERTMRKWRRDNGFRMKQGGRPGEWQVHTGESAYIAWDSTRTSLSE